jgi:IS5 family transposase
MLSRHVEDGRNQIEMAALDQLVPQDHLVRKVEHLRHTNLNKTLYAQRKETIERVFADAKEKHGMGWTALRGLKKVSIQAMLTFVAMNLKKLANWTWRGPCPV